MSFVDWALAVLRAGQGSALLRSTLVLSVVLLGAYVVAVWAMAGKPS